eukprot:3508101-Lingulodinium_polyedra.AAC.1
MAVPWLCHGSPMAVISMAVPWQCAWQAHGWAVPWQSQGSPMAVQFHGCLIAVPWQPHGFPMAVPRQSHGSAVP